MSPNLDVELERSLACPLDGEPVRREGDELVCPAGHAYAVIEGIPVMLVPGAERIHGYLDESLEAVERVRRGEPLGWEAELSAMTDAPAERVDPWVQDEIVRTCGGLYVGLHNRLPRYPIPRLRLPAGHGRRLLDVGCNWGRWTIAAARAGYDAVGIDPSLRSLLAARGVCRQLGVEARFVVGDARRLPFAKDAFDVGFSYSVFQHFPREGLEESLGELARVVRPDGFCDVQMANRFGLRQLYAERRQRAAPEDIFAVRRYSPGELKEIFERRIGPSRFEVDGFFTLNAQVSDLDLLPSRLRLVVRVSEALRRLSRFVPLLWRLADSLTIRSTPRR
jgi:SAM-dependent methyltransferase/uncharacterized protein YbaR (Trm112 family)